MDVLKMLSELRSERTQIEEAILVLERLARGHGKRRGRPPKWMSTEGRRPADPVSRKRRVVSPEARKRMAEAQRRRWATVRKTEAKDV